MKAFPLTVLALAINVATSALAANSQDSVLNPDLKVNVPTPGATGATTQGPPLTYTSTNEYTYEACPSGFTYNGSGQVPDQVRTVTTYYIGGAQVGQSTSPWYDLDADCTTTQYQQIPCPTGHTGVYFQSRNVTTADGDTLQYGDWTTYGNSCVYVPPPPVRGTILGCVQHDACLTGYWTGGGDAGNNWICTSVGDATLAPGTCSIETNSKGHEYLGVSLHGCNIGITATYADGNGGTLQMSTTLTDTCNQGGSCFVAGTRILMADGSWKRLESVRIGNAVMGADGLPSIVKGIETPEIGSRRVYRNADDSLR